MTDTRLEASTATDPRVQFTVAVALAGDVLTSVTPDVLDAATPCPELDVRSLCRHLVGVIRRVGAVGRGEEAMSVPWLADDVADDEFAMAWTMAANETQAVWSEPGILGRQMVLPFATLPGAAAIAVYTLEITVHTWDLAVATGQQPQWDDAVLALSLATAQQALPADLRGDGIPFDPIVPTAADAPLIDRLVAWTGRRPTPRIP